MREIISSKKSVAKPTIRPLGSVFRIHVPTGSVNGVADQTAAMNSPTAVGDYSPPSWNPASFHVKHAPDWLGRGPATRQMMDVPVPDYFHVAWRISTPELGRSRPEPRVGSSAQAVHALRSTQRTAARDVSRETGALALGVHEHTGIDPNAPVVPEESEEPNAPRAKVPAVSSIHRSV